MIAAGVTSAVAQSLGELARQQREKKQAASCLAPRVLFDDDLKQPRILTAEERACLEAARQKPAEAQAVEIALDVPLVPPAGAFVSLEEFVRHDVARKRLRGVQLAAAAAPESAEVPTAFAPPPAAAPLGDVARYYGTLKQMREAHPEQVATESAEVASSLAPPLPGTSLGEVARYYRALEALRQAQTAAGISPEPGQIARSIDATPAVEHAPLGDVARFYTRLRQLHSARLLAELATESSENPATLSVEVRPVTPPAPGAPLGDVARYYDLLRRQERAHAEAAVPAVEPPVLAAPAFSRAPLATIVAPAPAEPPAKENAAPEPVSAVPRSFAPAIAGVIEIAPGDTLWALAARHLGSGIRWNEIAAVNPEIVNPHFIRAGEALRLPAAPPLEEDLSGSRVVVARGDSLWRLAAAHLGHGAAWRCLAEANPQISNPDRIFPGQSLALPARCSAAR